MAPNKRSKGQGSVYAFRDGFAASIELPSHDGKRRRKVVTGKTVPIVKQKLKDMQREKMANGDLPTSGETLESWLNTWFRTIAVKKIRKRTADTYRSKIEQYIIPSIGKVQLNKLTPAHVRRMHDFIIVEKGLSSTSATQAHRILSVALKYAEREGRVAKNVATLTDAPVKARLDPVVLTAIDGLKVIREVTNDRLGSRIAAAFLTGARQGELLGLELDRIIRSDDPNEPDILDLSWQLQRLSWEHGCTGECGSRAPLCPKRTVTMPASSESRHLGNGLWLSRPKSSAGWRIIPLVDPLKSIIEHRIKVAASEPNPHGLLWTADAKKSKGGLGANRKTLPLDGAPVDPSRDNKYWHKVLERAGVPDARLHDARHTSASLLLAAGVPESLIMKILGHSSYVVTRGYQNVDRKQLATAMQAMSAEFTKSETESN